MHQKSLFLTTTALVTLVGFAIACSETADPGGEGSSSGGTSSGETTSSGGAGTSSGAAASSGNGGSSGKGGGTSSGGSSGSGSNPDFALVFNEVASSDDFLELYNPTNAAVDLSGYVVVDLDEDTGGPKAEGDEDRLVLPAGTSLAAGSYLTIVADADVASPTPVPCFVTDGGSGGMTCPAATFGISKADADAVFLLDADGNEILRLDLPASPDPDAGTPALSATESWGRFPNATGDFGIRTTRTPGRANE